MSPPRNTELLYWRALSKRTPYEFYKILQIQFVFIGKTYRRKQNFQGPAWSRSSLKWYLIRKKRKKNSSGTVHLVSFVFFMSHQLLFPGRRGCCACSSSRSKLNVQCPSLSSPALSFLSGTSRQTALARKRGDGRAAQEELAAAQWPAGPERQAVAQDRGYGQIRRRLFLIVS